MSADATQPEYYNKSAAKHFGRQNAPPRADSVTSYVDIYDHPRPPTHELGAHFNPVFVPASPSQNRPGRQPVAVEITPEGHYNLPGRVSLYDANTNHPRLDIDNGDGCKGNRQSFRLMKLFEKCNWNWTIAACFVLTVLLGCFVPGIYFLLDRTKDTAGKIK